MKEYDKTSNKNGSKLQIQKVFKHKVLWIFKYFFENNFYSVLTIEIFFVKTEMYLK